MSGRTYDAANKENEMNCLQDMHQEIFDMDPWEFPLIVNKNHKTGRTGSEQDDYCLLSEVRHTARPRVHFCFLCCVFADYVAVR